jgi:excisionase family DNA binding protein
MPLLKVAQVAERLSLSESKVYQLVEEGRIAHHRLGGAIRFSEEQVDAYLEATKREPREPGPKTPARRISRLKHIRLP